MYYTLSLIQSLQELLLSAARATEHIEHYRAMRDGNEAAIAPVIAPAPDESLED